MIDLIKGFSKSKTAWKDFFLFAVPAAMAYIPFQDEVVRQAISSFIETHPWVGFVLFAAGLFVRYLTTKPVRDK